MVLDLLGLLLLGLIAGGIARLFVRSPQRLGCLGTALLGVVGSYAGGSIGAILLHDKFDLRKASTFIGAIGGSIVVLALWRVFDRKPRR
ncbi:MAG: GlsB/YeaQ/YmgE family stress response membrane protein [Jatrophihabitantaceae bacterium]